MSVPYSNRSFSQNGTGSSVTSDGSNNLNLGIKDTQNHGGIFNKGSKVYFNDGTSVDINRSDLANVIMQERANYLNYQIAQEANALNYRMFNEQNVYNSALSQKNRFLEAGINPTAAMSNQGATASAGWSGAQVPQINASSAQGFDPINGLRNFGSLVQNVGGMASSSLNIVDAAKGAIDLGTRAANNLADLEVKKADTKSKTVQSAIASIQDDILRESKDAFVAKNQADAITAQEQSKLTSAQAAYQQLQNENFPERAKAEIAQIYEQTNLLREQGVSQQTQRKFFLAQIKKLSIDTKLQEKALSWYDTMSRANVGLIGAQTNAANAAATQSRAIAETQDSIRNLNNSITDMNIYSRNKLLPAQYKETKSRTYKNYVDMGTSIGNTLINGYGTFSKSMNDAVKNGIDVAKMIVPFVM